MEEVSTSYEDETEALLSSPCLSPSPTAVCLRYCLSTCWCFTHSASLLACCFSSQLDFLLFASVAFRKYICWSIISLFQLYIHHGSLKGQARVIISRMPTLDAGSDGAVFIISDVYCFPCNASASWLFFNNVFLFYLVFG